MFQATTRGHHLKRSMKINGLQENYLDGYYILYAIWNIYFMLY